MVVGGSLNQNVHEYRNSPKKMKICHAKISVFTIEMNIAPKYQVVPVWMLSILGIFIPIFREFKDISYQYT